MFIKRYLTLFLLIALLAQTNTAAADSRDSLLFSGLATKQKTIYYPNGLYSGYVFLGMRHGYGILKYENGDKYQGYWTFNKKNGAGTLYYSNGEKYEGAWQRNKMTGYGTYQTADTAYTGNWLDGKLIRNNTLGDQQITINEETKRDTVATKQQITFSPPATASVSANVSKEIRKTERVIKAPQPQKEKALDTLYGAPGKMAFGTKYVRFDDGLNYIGNLTMGQPNKNGKMIYPDGSYYNGEWKKGIRYGAGDFLCPNGTKYAGSWRDNQGYGTIHYPDGTVYDGDWENLKRIGSGILRYPSGDVYIVHPCSFVHIARWVAQYSASYSFEVLPVAIVHCAIGIVYEGTWVDDVQSGYGIRKFADSTLYTYEGEWKNGKRNGRGTLKYTDGRKFNGIFVDDKREGFGTLTDMYGNVEMECDWKNDMQVLDATTVEYSNGNKYTGYLDAYTGNLKMRKRTGYGIMEYADLPRYISFMSLQKYVGDWQNNRRHGKGTQFYGGPIKYEGYWKEGKRDGTGTLYLEGGKKLQGTWKNGRFMGDIPNKAAGNCNTGYGIKVDSEGMYEGFWVGGKRSGYGKYFKNNGTVIEGIWKRNVLDGRYTETNNGSVQYKTIYNGSEQLIRRDNTYLSLEWALIEAENVEELKLGTQDVRSNLFERIAELKQLKKLNITTDQPLADLPAIFKLTNLEELRVQFVMTYTMAQEFPTELAQLTKLKVLSMQGHSFTTIPAEIGALKQMEVLNLIGTNDETLPPLDLPDELWQLTKLKELYLSGNKISSIPTAVGNLTQMEILELQENYIRRLPDSFCQLSKLKRLNLFHNKLTALPENFGQLSALQFVDLVQNFLSSLPSSCCNLPATTALKMDVRLNSIPESTVRKIQNCLPNSVIKN